MRARMQRRRASNEGGFVLITVMLVLVVMVATVAVTLKEASSGIAAASNQRSKELVHAALDHGLDVALDQLQQTDPAILGDGSVNYDIFDRAAPGGEFAGNQCAEAGADLCLMYPTVGPNQNSMIVRIGLRPGPRTRPPAGEDVNSSYGQIMEIQLSVRTSRFGAEAEERAVVGVQLPHQTSHAN